MNKNSFLRIALLVYISLGVYFFIFIKQHYYWGISANYYDGNWVIHNVYNGGIAEKSGFKKGDQIIEVDGKESKSNRLLNKWLIVEQASAVSIKRSNEIIEVALGEENGISYKNNNYIYFFLFSILLFTSSYFYFRKHNISLTSKRYYIFLVFTSLLLLSIIPSSMGNLIARLILILYITLFPLFIDIFWRSSILKQASTKISSLSKIIILHSIMMLALLAYSQLFGLPLFLIEYLSRGIFYTTFIIIIFLFFYSILCLKGKEVPYRGNIIVLVLLCLLPLFIGYVFPLKFEVPFVYTIPLIILPAIAILKDLIINRLTTVRFRLPIPLHHLLISILIVLIGICLTLMSKFLPGWMIVTYALLLFLVFSPTIHDFFIMNTKIGYRLENQNMFLAAEMEREDISIYIHDTVIQDIIYHKKQIEAKNEVPVGDTLSVLDDVIFELRELCSNVYPLMIKELGLKSAILDIIDKLQKKEPVIIEHQFLTTNFNFDDKLNNFILRSVKEMFNNSILHGGAQKIYLKIYDDDKSTIIEVIDDGKFNSSSKDHHSHFGLNVIKEKIALLGGSLEISQNPTTVKLFIPVNTIKE